MNVVSDPMGVHRDYQAIWLPSVGAHDWDTVRIPQHGGVEFIPTRENSTIHAPQRLTMVAARD